MSGSAVAPLTEAVYYILLSLYSPLHGYGIMQNVKKLTDGRLELGAGTLYGAINALLSKGFIEEYPSDTPKKQYVITDLGKNAVQAEIVRLQELIKNGQQILKEND
ncbi:MAG: PadR family transcriptional regulator [Clostridia bacterium]|nr:PadR family transcriptional regulator [Clostridia bacterium]